MRNEQHRNYAKSLNPESKAWAQEVEKMTDVQVCAIYMTKKEKG